MYWSCLAPPVTYVGWKLMVPSVCRRASSLDVKWLFLEAAFKYPNVFQLSSVTQSCLTPCSPMECSTPGFPVHHQLLELAQTHVHWVSDAIRLSCPLLSPSPPAFNLSQNQGLYFFLFFYFFSGSLLRCQFFASVDQTIGAPAAASVLPMNIQDSFLLGLTGLISLQVKGLSRVFSNTTVQKHQFFCGLPCDISWRMYHVKLEKNVHSSVLGWNAL